MRTVTLGFASGRGGSIITRFINDEFLFHLYDFFEDITHIGAHTEWIELLSGTTSAFCRGVGLRAPSPVLVDGLKGVAVGGADTRYGHSNGRRHVDPIWVGETSSLSLTMAMVGRS